MAAAILLAVLVGLSRIHLGVGRTSEVLAGWCIGAVLAACCMALDSCMSHRRLVSNHIHRN
jgi:undecaprenyl-diphosphatase